MTSIRGTRPRPMQAPIGYCVTVRFIVSLVRNHACRSPLDFPSHERGTRRDGAAHASRVAAWPSLRVSRRSSGTGSEAPITERESCGCGPPVGIKVCDSSRAWPSDALSLIKSPVLEPKFLGTPRSCQRQA